MSNVKLFAPTLPSTKEIDKKCINAEHTIAALKKEISELQSRLDNTKIILNNTTELKNNNFKAYQRALALGRDAKAELNAIETVTVTIDKAEHEIKGLEELIPEKKKEIAPFEQFIKDRDYQLSLITLYSLYDKYNEQAEELAETLKKLFYANLQSEEAAQVSGASFLHHINMCSDRSMPQTLPKILPSSNIFTTTEEKFFWEINGFKQDHVRR